MDSWLLIVDEEVVKVLRVVDEGQPVPTQRTTQSIPEQDVVELIEDDVVLVGVIVGWGLDSAEVVPVVYGGLPELVDD